MSSVLSTRTLSGFGCVAVAGDVSAARAAGDQIAETINSRNVKPAMRMRRVYRATAAGVARAGAGAVAGVFAGAGAGAATGTKTGDGVGEVPSSMFTSA